MRWDQTTLPRGWVPVPKGDGTLHKSSRRQWQHCPAPRGTRKWGTGSLGPLGHREIQSLLSLTAASSEINDMGLEKSQAKQGLSHAKSFFWLPKTQGSDFTTKMSC